MRLLKSYLRNLRAESRVTAAAQMEVPADGVVSNASAIRRVRRLLHGTAFPKNNGPLHDVLPIEARMSNVGSSSDPNDGEEIRRLVLPYTSVPGNGQVVDPVKEHTSWSSVKPPLDTNSLSLLKSTMTTHYERPFTSQNRATPADTENRIFTSGIRDSFYYSFFE